jgi:Baseplate J-like protein
MGLLDVFRPAPDYTSLDFDSAKARIDNLVSGTFPNLQLNSNQMTMFRLLEAPFLFVLDVLSKRINNEANQARITTATLLPQILGLFRLINYFPPGRAAASVNLTFTLAIASAVNVPITIGQIVQTANLGNGQPALPFRVAEAGLIPAGQLTAILPAINSLLQTELYTSDGTVSQRFTLTFTPYILGSILVMADNGTYTKAPGNSFYNAASTDLVYVEYYDDLDRGIIIFGDGTNGAIPTGQITFTYQTGGGQIGNVPAGLITSIQGAIVDVNGVPVPMSVTNPAAAAGGADRPTIALLKRLGPLTQTAGPVTVKKSDFEVRAINVAGVARALAATSNQDIGIPENNTWLYLVPQGGGHASTLLCQQVQAQFTRVTGFPYPPPYPTSDTHVVEAFSANYFPVSWQAIVFLRAGADIPTTRAALQAAFQAYFALTIASSDPTVNGQPNPNVDFGGNLLSSQGLVDGRMAWSDMEDTVRNVAGVRRIQAPGGFLVNGLEQDVILTAEQFPVAGNFVVINGDTGSPL